MTKKRIRFNRTGLRELSLTPYPGVLFVTKSRRDFKRAVKDLFGDDDCDLTNHGGKFMAGPTKIHPHTSVVWWTTHSSLAHEMSHVVFDLFQEVGITDASCGNNEPFCYLLSQLILDATTK